MTRSETLQSILTKAKINTRRVSLLGAYAHIDTFEKYEAELVDLMSSAGFKVIMRKNGAHMDSFDGFRMVFQVKG